MVICYNCQKIYFEYYNNYNQVYVKEFVRKVTTTINEKTLTIDDTCKDKLVDEYVQDREQSLYKYCAKCKQNSIECIDPFNFTSNQIQFILKLRGKKSFINLKKVAAKDLLTLNKILKIED